MAVHRRLKVEIDEILEAAMEGVGSNLRKKTGVARMCMMRARAVKNPRW